MEVPDPRALDLALAERRLIGVATGIVMAARDCGPEQAWRTLCEEAGRRRIGVLALATIVVEARNHQ